MQKRIMGVEESAPVRVVIVTLDNHLASAAARANAELAAEIPGIQITLHATSNFDGDPDSLTRCIHDIGEADIVIATMLFMDDQIRALMPALEARRQ